MILSKPARLKYEPAGSGLCHAARDRDGWVGRLLHHSARSGRPDFLDPGDLNHLHLGLHHVQQFADHPSPTTRRSPPQSGAACAGIFKFHHAARVAGRDTVDVDATAGARGSIRAGFVLDLRRWAFFIRPRPRPVASLQGQFQLLDFSRSIFSMTCRKASSATFAIAGGGPEPSWSWPAMSPRSWHFPPAKAAIHRLNMAAIIGEVYCVTFDMHMATTNATLIGRQKTKAVFSLIYSAPRRAGGATPIRPAPVNCLPTNIASLRGKRQTGGPSVIARAKEAAAFPGLYNRSKGPDRPNTEA